MKFDIGQDHAFSGRPDPSGYEEAAFDEPAPSRRDLWPAAIAMAGSVLWIAAATWWSHRSLPLLDPPSLIGWLAAVATVPALIGILFLVARRGGRAEARRFGDTARSMREETAALGRAVTGLTATLAANREELDRQARLLFDMSDTAGERMAQVGTILATEIRHADDHASTLTHAAAAAEASVGALLDALPAAHARLEAARDLLNHTADTADARAAALDMRLHALADRGRSAGEIADGAGDRLAAHLARMEMVDAAAGGRLEAATARASAEVDALLSRATLAVEGARDDAGRQGETMLAMMTAHRAALDEAARVSADALADRLAQVEATVERLADGLARQHRAGDALVDGLHDGIEAVDARLAALHAQGVDRSQLLAASISALGGSADAMTQALMAGEAMATRTIATTESLLIALDAAAREIDETLPDALGRLDDRVGRSRQVVVQAKPELLALVTAAESTHDAIEAIAGVIGDQRRTLEHLQSGLGATLADGRGQAEALGRLVDDTIGRTQRFSEDAAPRLVEALLRVRETASVAADAARETLGAVIPDTARQLEKATAAALARATGDTVERRLAALADASDAAVGGTARAVERLSAHLQSIADQTALVETRLEEVRAERAAAAGDGFARKASLLIEALHSASIDLTKAMAPEITDSAWAAYLKGDRGVFTRRAVRLIDGTVARDVLRLYDDRTDFREGVNRYIHDFEAMLRDVLAQRDGQALSVALLSSDLGKLYVALAQAIERLR